MSNVIETAGPRGDLLSTDAIRLAAGVTGGPTFWFLWKAGSGQELLRLPSQGMPSGLELVSVTAPGRSIELEARMFEEANRRWRMTRRPSSPKQRRTPLGRRLDEIRERIRQSGQPLLSWEDIDRELSEQRNPGT